MNKKLIGVAIRIVPNRLQTNALAKALNFIFSEQSVTWGENAELSIAITDLKQLWRFNLDNGRFTPLQNAPSQASSLIVPLSVSTTLDTVLTIKNKQTLFDAINNGSVILEGSQTQALIDNIAVISQDKIDQLIDYGYRFLRLKQAPRLNIDSVTLADVKTAQDVNFLRDEAIRLEATDLAHSLRLMEIAHQARPNGRVIKNKLQQYRAKVKKLANNVS